MTFLLASCSEDVSRLLKISADGKNIIINYVTNDITGAT